MAILAHVTDVKPSLFQLAPQARLLTPDMPGLRDTVAAVRSGHSIATTGNPDRPITIRPGGKQVLACQTAGSSGAPKIIQRTPASWMASFDVNQRMFQITADDSYAVLGSLAHSLALYGVMEALHIGADVASLCGQAPRTQLRQLRDVATTILYATPAQLRLLLSVNKDISVPTMRLILAGGGKLDRDTREGLMQIFPRADVFEFFGASETSFISLSDAGTPEGSVGRPYPSVSLWITPLGPDAPGEIWVRSPYLFAGYADGRSVEWCEGAVSIGETGYLDAKGYLFLTGRKTRMFTVADQNVFPERIEQVLQSHPDIRAAVVLPRPDPLRGQIPVCIVEADPEVTSDILHHCRGALRPHEVPRAIVTVERIPLLPSGKPDMQRLRLLIGQTS